MIKNFIINKKIIKKCIIQFLIYLRLKYIIFIFQVYLSKFLKFEATSFHVDLGFELSIVNTVSINNNVLGQVSETIESIDVRNWWLIYRPVVEWWVLNWVGSLSQFYIFWFHLSDVQMVWSNFDCKIKISMSFGVMSDNRVYKYWNTLGKSLWLRFFLQLDESFWKRILLWKSNCNWWRFVSN